MMREIFLKIAHLVTLVLLVVVLWKTFWVPVVLWESFWAWLQLMSKCEVNSRLLCTAWSKEDPSEFTGVMFKLPFVSYQMKLEDVLTFVFVQLLFAFLLERWREQRASKDLFEQPVHLAANRITIGLNSVGRDGVLKLRTLSDTETARVFHNPAQVKELINLCRDMVDDDAERIFLAALREGLVGAFRAPRPPRQQQDPFVRAHSKDAAERLGKVLKNFVSSMFCIGHVAIDMGDTRTTTGTFFFGLTYETALTAKADRKLRLLLIRKSTLMNLDPNHKFEVTCGTDEENKENGYNYYRHRLKTLMELRDHVRDAEKKQGDPKLVIGKVSLSVPVTPDQ